MRCATVVLTAALLLMAACSQDADEATAEGASDPALFMACAESRGSLLELDAMLGGSKRLDTSTLEYGAGMLGQLADRVSATNDVRVNLGRWTRATTNWRNELRTIEPKIENGRLIEPDTSALDQALVAELQAVRKPLASWVDHACEGARL